jgi:C4-dicarboxylate-specific signal transduction histidine kinase
MQAPLRILHLEDDPKDAELIHATLEAEGIVSDLTRVETQTDFLASLERGGFDLIFADFTLPSFDGLSALKMALQKCPGVPFIFISGTLGEEVAIEALKIGATDYILKQRLSRIVPSVHRAIRESNERAERKRAEDALRHAQMELTHVTRIATLGEMTASIAHEINQPLSAIANSASACLRWLDAQKLEEARRSASRVIAESHRASEIIGRIRELAKKAPPRKDWLDVNETIHEVIALVQSGVQRHRIAVEAQLSDDVPLISADRVQLQQVILNLMMNAIEAMSGTGEGSRELLVRSGTDESRRVLVSVQDSGPGLDPKSLDRLFDAFYTTKPQGLGMGLAISRSLVEAHGGRLWASANVPHGAVFQFTLPIDTESEA